MKPKSTTKEAFKKLLKTDAWKEAGIKYGTWKGHRAHLKEDRISLDKMEAVLTKCKVKKIQETMWEI
jgi:hypothetical protein